MKTTIGRDTRLCMSLAARPGTFGSRFHNRLYDVLGLDYVYKAFTTTDLPAAIGAIRALNIRGCGVSMPFKEAVIPLLDALDGSATAIDSVNTIVNDGGRLTGSNTDYGAVRDLLEASGADVTRPVVLRGSGGMAKAMLAAFRDAGFTSGTLIARNAGAGAPLAAAYGYAWQAEMPERLEGAILANATPLGMAGSEAETLAFPAAAVAGAALVFDVVALPVETPFIRAARAAGVPVIDGGQVAVGQALAQFVRYTGVTPTPAQVAEAAAFARAG